MLSDSLYGQSVSWCRVVFHSLAVKFSSFCAKNKLKLNAHFQSCRSDFLKFWSNWRTPRHRLLCGVVNKKISNQGNRLFCSARKWPGGKIILSEWQRYWIQRNQMKKSPTFWWKNPNFNRKFFYMYSHYRHGACSSFPFTHSRSLTTITSSPMS